MKRKLSIILILFAAYATVLAQTVQFNSTPSDFSQQEIKEYIAFMADDVMQGRDTPSPFLDSCAAYIASHYTTWGLKPAHGQASYFQVFNVLRNSLGRPNRFTVNKPDTSISFRIKYDFVPLASTSSSTVSGDIVFAGYGITAPEYSYDDYASINAAEKIVLILTGEPQEKDSSSVFDGTLFTDHSKLNNKLMNAQAHGAKGVILVTGPLHHRFRKPPNAWPSLMRRAPDNAVPLSFEENSGNMLVSVQIGKKLSEALVEPMGTTLEQLQQQIDSSLKPCSAPVPGITVTIQTSLESEKTPVMNVIGMIPGSDPELKHETVIFGGHYDHLGVKNDTIIYNGADDNASGTAGVMALAHAFSKLPKSPRRTLVFCTWAGEEKGLFGSRFYVNSSPLFPIENTAAYINLDMIGRSDSSYVRVSGISSSPCFQPLFDKLSKKYGLRVEERPGVSGSDHVPFYNKNVPVAGFNTGLHKDYHKPTDTLEKIDLEGQARICALVFELGGIIANMDSMPEFKKINE